MACAARPPAAAPVSAGLGDQLPGDQLQLGTANASASSARCCRARAVDGPGRAWSPTPKSRSRVFGFGGLCVMVRGRCALSALHFTGSRVAQLQRRLLAGQHVRWEDTRAAWRRGSTASSSTASRRQRYRLSHPVQGSLRGQQPSQDLLRPRGPTSLNARVAARTRAASASARSRSGSPAPGLRRPGRRCWCRARQVEQRQRRHGFSSDAAGVDSRTQQRSPKARATPSAPTTARGSEASRRPPAPSRPDPIAAAPGAHSAPASGVKPPSGENRPMKLALGPALLLAPPGVLDFADLAKPRSTVFTSADGVLAPPRTAPGRLAGVGRFSPPPARGGDRSQALIESGPTSRPLRHASSGSTTSASGQRHGRGAPARRLAGVDFGSPAPR